MEVALIETYINKMWEENERESNMWRIFQYSNGTDKTVENAGMGGAALAHVNFEHEDTKETPALGEFLS